MFVTTRRNNSNNVSKININYTWLVVRIGQPTDIILNFIIIMQQSIKLYTYYTDLLL